MLNIIYEYEEIKDEELKTHIINNSVLHQYFKLDWKTLKARQYCGILNFDNQDFYILPKIVNHNNEQNLNIFIYMLMYAYDIKLSNEQIASCKNDKHSILEVFVQMFASNLLNELKKGLYKEYLTQQDNLPVLKGKYLINENLKYNFTKNKIYCEYDEFSENKESVFSEQFNQFKNIATQVNQKTKTMDDGLSKSFFVAKNFYYPQVNHLENLVKQKNPAATGFFNYCFILIRYCFFFWLACCCC